jgi:hydroxyacylglutathione hydrolase
MFFKQYAVAGMGCLSYLIGCPMAQKACVVDPKRDVQEYLSDARKNGMQITHVLETHVHADHVSGNMEIKSRTGAKICMMKDSPVRFDFIPLDEGDILDFGNVSLTIINTPGHTPHGISILVTDKSRGDDPWLILTGDCLFVGDIGRPDLAGAELIDEQVDNLYHSLHHKLGKLPESIEVFPAHGQGSLCGKGMSAKPSSTIGFEMRHNPIFGLPKENFQKSVTTSFPERPKSFTHIIDTNKAGAPLLERCPISRDLSPHQVKALLTDKTVLLDTRDTASFGGVHIPGSINIGLAPQSANWIGMVIDPDVDLVMVVADEKTYENMCTELHRIGYDNILGYLDGGIAAWQEAGLPIDHLWQISPTHLQEKIKRGNSLRILDVRTDAERAVGYIEGSVHIPLPRLLKEIPDLSREVEIILTCGVGYRGNIAASFLARNGFHHVHSIAGGIKAWTNAGLPLVH